VFFHFSGGALILGSQKGNRKKPKENKKDKQSKEILA